jgi:hypothetical protein
MRWPPPILLSALVCQAQSAEPFAPPRLEVVPAGTVDLGSLGPRETRTQAYAFSNLSAAPLALRVLDLSPGVTVAGPALGGPIAAHGTATLTLAVDASDWLGPQARNVRLGTDDPRQGSYYLPIRMVVRPDLTVDRERASFGEVAGHESPRQVFRFVRETGEPTRLRVTSPLPAYLETDLETVGGGTRLAVTFRPARVAPGARLGFEQLTVETSAPLQPRFDLYLEWRLIKAIEAAPTRVVFQDPAQDSAALALAARDGKPFRILSASIRGEGFRVEGLPGPGGPEQTLRIRRTATGAARAVLELAFEGQEAPLEVPLAYLPATPPDRH